jgi:hypothetical protein
MAFVLERLRAFDVQFKGQYSDARHGRSLKP